MLIYTFWNTPVTWFQGSEAVVLSMPPPFLQDVDQDHLALGRLIKAHASGRCPIIHACLHHLGTQDPAILLKMHGYFSVKLYKVEC